MTQQKFIGVAFAALLIGFLAGFLARPMIGADGVATPAQSVAIVAAPPRGVQYFAAHLGEARATVAGCLDGTVLGDECAHADQAIATAEGRARTASFLGRRPAS